MQFENISYTEYNLALRSPLRTAFGEISHRSGILLEGTLPEGVRAYGDAAPLEDFSAESLDEVRVSFVEMRDALEKEQIPESPEQLKIFLATLSQHKHLPPSLEFAIETLLSDAAAKKQGLSLARWWNASAANEIHLNAILSGDADRIVRQAEEKFSAGYRTFKLKLSGNRDSDLARIERIEQAIPKGCLRLDANRAYKLDDIIALLKRVDSKRIEYLEEPIANYSLQDYTEIRRTTGVRLALDESLLQSGVLESALLNNAADYLILKPAMFGGCLRLQKIIARAARSRINSVLTTTLESGVGVTACLHIAAALVPEGTVCGLDTEEIFEADHMNQPFSKGKGSLIVPDEIGLGRSPVDFCK